MSLETILQFIYSPTGTAVGLGLGVLAFVFLIAYIITTEIRLKKIFRGGTPTNLENVLANLGTSVTRLEGRTTSLEDRTSNTETRISRAVRGVGVLRFNPFKGAGIGGNQSFSVALTNDKGDGVVVSSIYARERINMYAKDLKEYKSPIGLSEEETAAVAQAKEYSGN